MTITSQTTNSYFFHFLSTQVSLTGKMKYSVSASVFIFLTLGAHIEPALAGPCGCKMRDGDNGKKDPYKK